MVLALRCLEPRVGVVARLLPILQRHAVQEFLVELFEVYVRIAVYDNLAPNDRWAKTSRTDKSLDYETIFSVLSDNCIHDRVSKVVQLCLVFSVLFSSVLAHSYWKEHHLLFGIALLKTLVLVVAIMEVIYDLTDALHRLEGKGVAPRNVGFWWVVAVLAGRMAVILRVVAVIVFVEYFDLQVTARIGVQIRHRSLEAQDQRLRDVHFDGIPGALAHVLGQELVGLPEHSHRHETSATSCLNLGFILHFFFDCLQVLLLQLLELLLNGPGSSGFH